MTGSRMAPGRCHQGRCAVFCGKTACEALKENMETGRAATLAPRHNYQ
jgi:hypothetical protein